MLRTSLIQTHTNRFSHVAVKKLHIPLNCLHQLVGLHLYFLPSSQKMNPHLMEDKMKYSLYHCTDGSSLCHYCTVSILEINAHAVAINDKLLTSDFLKNKCWKLNIGIDCTLSNLHQNNNNNNNNNNNKLTATWTQLLHMSKLSHVACHPPKSKNVYRLNWTFM